MLSDAFGSQRSPWGQMRQTMPNAFGGQQQPGGGNQGPFGGQIPDIRSMFGQPPPGGQPGQPGQMFSQMLSPSQIPQALQQLQAANAPQAQPAQPQPFFGASPDDLWRRLGIARPTGY